MAKDKLKHLLAGYSIATLVGLLCSSHRVGLVSAIIAGILKEAYDKLTGKGTCELLDFVATALGGLLGYLLLERLVL